MKKILLLILLSFTINTYSQVKSYVDSNSVNLGKRVNLKIEISAKKTDDIRFFLPKDTVNKFDVIDLKIDTIKNKTSKNITFIETIVLGAFQEGSLYIDPIKIVINKDTLYTNKIPVVVIPVEIDTTKSIFDIRGIAGVPYTIKEILTFIAYGVLGLSAIILIIYFLFFRKKEGREIIKKKIIIPPFTLAKDNLHKLKEKDFLEKGFFKEYYTELTDILREYLHGQFGIDAMELTSNQIIKEIKNNILIDKDILYKLEELLVNSDLVKFAKSTPLVSEGKEDFKYISNFIITLNKKVELEKENDDDNEKK